MEEKKAKYESVQVPVQHITAIRNNEEQTILQDQEILTEILNKLDKLERGLL